MHGDADPANPLEACAFVAAELREAGALVRHHHYPRATFAWDHPAYGGTRVSRLPAPGLAERALVQHWPELAEMSAAQTADFFGTALVGRAVSSTQDRAP
jgi:dienelactone hydrolase